MGTEYWLTKITVYARTTWCVCAQWDRVHVKGNLWQFWCRVGSHMVKGSYFYALAELLYYGEARNWVLVFHRWTRACRSCVQESPLYGKAHFHSLIPIFIVTAKHPGCSKQKWYSKSIQQIKLDWKQEIRAERTISRYDQTLIWMTP